MNQKKVQRKEIDLKESLNLAKSALGEIRSNIADLNRIVGRNPLAGREVKVLEVNSDGTIKSMKSRVLGDV